MSAIQRTSLANEYLVGIALRIAEANPAAANTWLDTVEQKCRLLATMPEMGRLRPELAPQLRSWVVGEYVIFYRPILDGILLVRVLHGSRDLAPLLAS
jgi:toxin ParE1/3/4